MKIKDIIIKHKKTTVKAKSILIKNKKLQLESRYYIYLNITTVMIKIMIFKYGYLQSDIKLFCLTIGNYRE